MKTYLLSLSVIFWIVASPMINAEETAEEEIIDQLLELSLSDLLDIQITTASKTEENITDTPVTAVVITKRQIRERGYRNLLDLLKDLPGVDVHAFNHQVFLHTIAMRGHIHSDKFLILQDGVRIDSPTGEAVPIAENFPLYHAKQVEIVYGPAAALYGADAFGGVINIITEKVPEQQSIRLSVGSDSYRYYSTHVGKQLTEDVSVSAGGHVQKADYGSLASDYPDTYQFGDVTTFSGQVYKQANDREDFYAKEKSNSLFARLDYKDNLTFGINHSFMRHPTTTGERPNVTQYGSGSQWNTELNSAFARLRYDIDDALSGETLLHYAEYEIDPDSKFKNIYVDYLDAYIYSQGEKYSIEQQLAYQINDAHLLIAGINYEDFYSIPKTTDLPTPYNKDRAANAQNLYHIGTDNTLPIEIYELNYDNYAFYLQWQAKWRDDLSTNVGMRYDKNSRYRSTFNPRVGLVYHPTEKTTWKLFYGEAFRAPSPVDTHEVFGIFSGQQNEQGEYTSYFFHTPNSNLDPEKLRGVETNFIYNVTENMHWSLSGYYTQIADRILRPPEENPTQFIPGGSILSSQHNENIGDAKQYGLELAGHYQTQLNADWQMEIWGNYSYLSMDSAQKDDLDKGYDFFVSPHKLKLGTTLRYQNRYIFTPKLYAISKIDTENKSLKTPGYAVLDLHSQVALFKNLSLSLDIYNAFNRRYYNSGSDSSTRFTNVPQPLRSFLFSVEYRF